MSGVWRNWNKDFRESRRAIDVRCGANYASIVNQNKPSIPMTITQVTRVCRRCHGEFLTVCRVAKYCPNCRVKRESYKGIGQ